MINEIVEKLTNKKIGILGFGKEGQATYKFIRKYMGDIDLTIIDLKDVREKVVNDSHVEVVFGDNYLESLDKYDVIIKSPGITLKDIKNDEIKKKVTSELELLLEVNRDNIIGITGTKGKSTTSSLLYQVLKDQGKDVFLLGNIGIPVFDLISEYNESSTLVVEMSSDQLEFVHVSPHIGIILNLYQDHLDHSGTLEHYHESKLNMFKYQNESDIMMYADDNDYLHKYVEENNYLGKKYPVRFDNIRQDSSINYKDGNVYFNNELIYTDGKRNLLGDHNLKNIMFVLGLVKLLDIDLAKAIDTISKFNGLKYRMEYIGTFNGITYYNDTIATIPEATISAIKAIDNIDTLIFGGMDRGIDYQSLIEFLKKSKIKNLICMPTTGYNIGKVLDGRCDKNIYYCETLTDAYKRSVLVTEKNKSCLLSPAASSYEYFKNFEEKGKAFEELVRSGENGETTKR